MQQDIINKIMSADMVTEPFNYVVIKNFIGEEMGRKLAEQFPAEDSSYWTRRANNKNTVRKLSVGGSAPKYPGLPEELASYIRTLNSEKVVKAIGDKFGFEGLMDDKDMVGGGLHAIGRGGFLKLHADFNLIKERNMHRRVNLLVYLNYDWDSEWGGDIELWDTALKVGTKVASVNGTAVLFNTTDDSYHGHPHPLNCPEDRMRKSIALYYYTPIGDYQSDWHSTIYVNKEER